MGNKNSEQQQFDPKLLEEHQRKMNQVRGQYSSHQQLAPGAYYQHRTQKKQVNMTGIKREIYLYKPSIDIDLLPQTQQVKIHFDYRSSTECYLEIFLGVQNVKRQQQASQSREVKCLWKIAENLPPSQKKHEEKVYTVGGNVLNKITSTGVIFRISTERERSEYSVCFMKNNKIWKVLMEIFTKEGKQYRIEDIYGGGQGGQECIICFSESSTTMIKPCNHLCMCKECSESMQGKQDACPICRMKIMELVTLNKS